ncbi:MAG: hypothetical protein PGN22_15525 [Agrobacterium cavarae]
MALKLANLAVSKLAASITDSATTLSIQNADTGKFPVLAEGDWHPATIIDQAGNLEIVRVTARAGATLTVMRAQEGTTAKAFAAGSRIDIRLTAATVLSILQDLNTLDEHIDDVVDTLNEAIATKLNKSGGAMSWILRFAYDYPQLWFGDAATGTGWRIIKDTPEGQVGSLVFQCSTDRWAGGANMKTAMYLGADGVAHFEGGVQIKTNDVTFGPGAGGKLSKLQANGDVMLNRGDNTGFNTWNAPNAYFGWDGGRYVFGPAGGLVAYGYLQVDGPGLSSKLGPSGDIDFSGFMLTEFGPYLSTVLRGFKSGNQPYVLNGSGSVAHGLGRKPSKLSSYLVCTTAIYGWSVGDEFEVAPHAWSNQADYGITLWADTTNVFWKFPRNGLALIGKSDGVVYAAPAANFALRVRGAL